PLSVLPAAATLPMTLPSRRTARSSWPGEPMSAPHWGKATISPWRATTLMARSIQPSTATGKSFSLLFPPFSRKSGGLIYSPMANSPAIVGYNTDMRIARFDTGLLVASDSVSVTNTDGGIQIPVGGRDLVYDASRNVLYITSGAFVYRYNTITQSLL